MKKHILLVATSLSFSLTAFAGGIDEVVAIVPEVIIPKLPGGFFVGGSGYYLQFSATGAELDYASVNPLLEVTLFDPTTDSFAGVESSQVGHLIPNYTWGWGAFLGYTFPGTGNDITLDYFHFQGSKDDDSAINATHLHPFGSFAQPLMGDITSSLLVSEGLYSKVQGHVGYYANQADLTVGQFINIGSRLQIHPNGGLRWATVHRDVSATFVPPTFDELSVACRVTNTSSFTSIEQTTNTNSHYTGLGPILGLDASYDLWYGFAAVGHFDAALLAGNLHTELSSNFNALISTTIPQALAPTPAPSKPTLTATQFGYSATSSDIRRLVPAVDAKLGLNYLYDFKDGMSLTAEIGWSLSNYFNVVDGLSADNLGVVKSLTSNSAPVTMPGGSESFIPPASITGHNTADVGLQGLYFDLMLTM